MLLFPSKREAIITSVIMAFVSGLGLGIISSTDFAYIGEISGTLFAAFSGAYFAFKLDKKKRQEEINSENVRAANKAIFNLIRIYQAVESYRRQFIEGHLTSPLRYVSIRSSLGFQSWMEDFDFESLSYLFDSSKPNLLMDVYELQQEVISTIELVQERNKIYSERIEPAMKDAGINQGDDVRETDFQRILKQYDIDIMKNYTDELIRCVDSIVERSERLVTEMHEFNTKTYPSYKIIRMQKINKPMHATGD